MLMDRSPLIRQNGDAIRCGAAVDISGVKRMRANRLHAVYCLSALLAQLVACAWTSMAASRAREDQRPVSVQLSFDRPLDASMAPFVLAAASGLFGAEGVSVRMNFANGSPEAIARVASGESEFALIDINELVRFRDKANAPPIKAVFVLFNRAPYAIVARTPQHPLAVRYRRQDARGCRKRPVVPPVA